MATYLITGASRGIGAEMTARLRQRGDTVIAACRNPAPHLEKLGARVIDGIEVTNPLAVARLADELTGQKIDVLITFIFPSGEWIDEN